MTDSIDCPEMDLPYGKKAKRATSDLVFGKMVSIRKTGEARFKIILAFVEVDGINLSEHLVKNGFAWNYVTSPSQKNLKKRSGLQNKTALDYGQDSGEEAHRSIQSRLGNGGNENEV